MRPSVIAFDVNETLSDMSPLGARFIEVGASASIAPLWFSGVLRDGFALTAAGEKPAFADVAHDLLVSLLAQAQLNRSVEEAARHVMDGFAGLELHPDIASGVQSLHEQGFRLVTLSNGSASVADRLLTTAGIRDQFERLLSVEGAESWKPAAAPYRYAAAECGVEPDQVALVAVHPWDVDGATRAGLQSVWVNRSEATFPSIFTSPTHTVASVDEIADLWDDSGHDPVQPL
jgi:2-haloacid dehalogenase